MKVSIRLFMPGTASRTSGQLWASCASAQMRCCEVQAHLAGRLEQQRGRAQQADRRRPLSVRSRRAPLLQPAFEVMDVDAAGGKALVAQQFAVQRHVGRDAVDAHLGQRQAHAVERVGAVRRAR
jgi:hypothetical protein